MSKFVIFYLCVVAPMSKMFNKPSLIQHKPFKTFHAPSKPNTQTISCNIQT